MNLPKLFSTTLAIAFACTTVTAVASNNPTKDKKKAKEDEKKPSIEAEASDPEPLRMPLLAIEPPLNTEELAIIPNPTEAMFRFSYYMPGIDILHIRLEDEMGTLIHQMEIGGHEEMYNLPFKFWQYPDGVYYLQVETTQKTYKRRIVKANYSN